MQELAVRSENDMTLERFEDRSFVRASSMPPTHSSCDDKHNCNKQPSNTHNGQSTAAHRPLLWTCHEQNNGWTSEKWSKQNRLTFLWGGGRRNQINENNRVARFINDDLCVCCDEILTAIEICSGVSTDAIRLKP